jgi:SNF2 family DNA or RNA helicase
MPHGSALISLAQLSSSWRPWEVKHKGNARVNVTFPGFGVASDIHLISAPLPVKANMPSASVISTLSLNGCSQAITILDVELETSLTLNESSEFSAFSWTLENAKLLPSHKDWQFCPAPCKQKSSQCAPPIPKLLWNVSGGVARAQEDRKAAATFERAVKSRPDVFFVQPKSNHMGIHISINPASLMHRASGRLQNSIRGLQIYSTTAQHSQACTTAWRLLTDHVQLAWEPLPKYQLHSNAKDALHFKPPQLEYELSPAQKQSLQWMQLQERGIPLSIEEVEEAIHAELGWRLEALARTTVTVRGGVLADLPSFGKTVTTIGLVHSEYEQKDPAKILEENLYRSSNLHDLIEVTATLIICPPHITIQWREEAYKFLGQEQCEKYDILLVETFDELCNLTIERVHASRLIIMSWAILSDDRYISQLAQFAAVPPPAMNRGRAFDAWLEYVIELVPARLEALDATGMTSFNANIQTTLQDRLARPEFQAEVPISIKHGSAYQSWKTMSENSAGKKATKPKPISTAATFDHGWNGTPLLQLFRFNRVVIDEYHYLSEKKKKKPGEPQEENYPAYAALKKLSAHKRWILSGTPALSNFTDVNEIANLLGVTLGRDIFTNDTTATPLEKRLALDQTDVEKFLSRMENMTHQWHKVRHQRAQQFLDDFVRQNSPSLEHIDSTEALRPIELSAAHQAVYLELSQHCIALQMQVKKMHSNSKSDRIDRFNSSLHGSANAEEALIKTALHFQTTDGASGVNALIRSRQDQIRETENELLELARYAASFAERCEDIEDHLGHFKRDMKDGSALGDMEATLKVRKALAQAEQQGTHKIEKNISKIEYKKRLKHLTSDLRVAGQELVLRVRSDRFIKSIQRVLTAHSKGAEQLEGWICDSSDCSKTASNISELLLISSCGHVACVPCLEKRTNDQSCVCSGCNITVEASNLLRASDLGSSDDEIAERSFGRKLDDISDLINNFPKDDQGVVFVPNPQTMVILEEVFDYHDISYCSISNRFVSKKIEDFKKNIDAKKRKKIIILNLGDESAAGVNLVNANHVIFVSPMLVESQYKYDSAMAQAIARCRRYGQIKKVYIYHFVALRTIDVDILEQRHKRVDGMSEYQLNYKASKEKALMNLPFDKLPKREKTKLVRNVEDRMALVPVTWAADDAKRQAMGVPEENIKFTSLISFSDLFCNEDE